MNNFTLTAQELAYCSFIGTVLSGMGGIYLTYEFFGGRQGPLGQLTRVFTYAFIFGIGYGLFFGLYFGLVTGVGFGLLLSFELYKLRSYQKRYNSSPLQLSPNSGVARGLIYGIASLRQYGPHFSVTFGLLTALGLFVVYRLGHAPSNNFSAQERIVFSKRRLIGALWRGAAVGLAGGLAGLICSNESISVGPGLLIGTAVSTMSFTATTISPRIEWWLENLPDRHLGILGAAMILVGLSLQTIPDIVTILGIPVDAVQGTFRSRFLGPH